MRRAQGLPPAEDGEDDGAAEDPGPTGPPPEPVPSSTTERRLEDLRFGHFWSAFADGARCTVRMHHERLWYEEGSTLYDEAAARPGTNFTYAPASGFLVQVFSDGVVHQTWPPQVRSAAVTMQRASSSSVPAPGGPGDVEVARTVTPLGVVTRELLSGRHEIYHPDGTRVFRNPPLTELQSRQERVRSRGASVEADFLQDLLAAYTKLQTWQSSGKPPPQHVKAEGLPGHWVVTRPDGRVFGRAPAPPKLELKLRRETEEGEGEAGGGDEEETATVADGEVAEQEGQRDPAQALKELLEGRWVDNGAVIEYEIDPISVSVHVDPHTGQQVATSGDGLMIVEDAEVSSWVAVLADGTRISSKAQSQGAEEDRRIDIEHGQLASITCLLKGDNGSLRADIDIKCGDGAELQVTPQRLASATEFCPADPKGGEGRFSSNAAVLLRTRDGAAVLSKGAGEVRLATRSDAAGPTGELRMGAYEVQLDGDRLCMQDADGNHIEVSGDQTVSCKAVEAAAQGRFCPPPRCKEPGRAYGRPDAISLSPPPEAPPPRLLVVYGDGEAEELLPAANARQILELAKQDPNTFLTEGEPMGSPMDRCKCHTIYRTACPDPPAPPTTSFVLPPTVAGFRGAAPSRSPQRSFTELRQLVEYPTIDEQERHAFLAACARFDAREEAHCAEHAAYGEGLRAGAVGSSVSRKASVLQEAAPAEGGA